VSDAAQRHAPRPAGPEAVAALEEGIRRFRRGDVEGAHQAFAGAHRRASGDPRVVSWYGVTLVLVEKNSNLGMLFADQAVRVVGPLPELALNQARVAVALGQREHAVRALERGLEAAPGHPGLTAARVALGRRRRPVLPFLPRSNVLNRWLGRLRHRWFGLRGDASIPSPATLGELGGAPAAGRPADSPAAAPGAAPDASAASRRSAPQE
jgi:hypothetical protein